MTNQSETTTGELIEFLMGEPLLAYSQCADRLESQERIIAELHEQIAEKNDEIQMARDGIEDTIAALTARAEKAEVREKAAVAEKERILNLRASENPDNKYLYML